MSCCDGWNYPPDTKEPKECSVCGADVGEDGYALSGCNYSPVDCETCGSAPCDLSC